MSAADDPGPITEQQRELYDALEENGTDGTCLMSVTEKATGQQRAVVCSVAWDEDTREYVTRPIFLLLEHLEDMDRFTPPGGIADHGGHEVPR